MATTAIVVFRILVPQIANVGSWPTFLFPGTGANRNTPVFLHWHCKKA